MPLRLDASRSDIRIRTRAVGMLSAFAHDLEIVASDLSGDASDGDAGTVRARAAVSGLRVEGVVRSGRVDSHVLSKRDVETIERQLRETVLPIASIDVSGTYDARRVRLSVRGPAGTHEIECAFDRSATDRAVRVRGRFTLALSKLGVREVRGPMGAFRVANDVDVSFDVCFLAE
jgi:hypothetical protein